MTGYIRADFSCFKDDDIFIIPTIRINKFPKGIEVSLLFLCFCVYGTTRYINEDEYEP